MLENIPGYHLYESFSVFLATDPECAYQRLLRRCRPQEMGRVSLEDLKKLDQKHKDWFANDLWPPRGNKGEFRESKYGAYIMNADDSIASTVDLLYRFVCGFCVDPKLSNLTERINLASEFSVFSTICSDDEED